MLETYRVRRQFQWKGYIYDRAGRCTCACVSNNKEDECAHKNGGNCVYCQTTGCKCSCTVNDYAFAGDIWMVDAGHPRKEAMIRAGFVYGDASIPSADELIKDSNYSRLLKPRGDIDQELEGAKKTRKEKVAAGA